MLSRLGLLVAPATALLRVCWHPLTHGQSCQDLGPDYFDQLHRDRLERMLVKSLEKLGHKVTLQPGWNRIYPFPLVLIAASALEWEFGSCVACHRNSTIGELTYADPSRVHS